MRPTAARLSTLRGVETPGTLGLTEITDILRAFVRKHVRTVGQLEVLLLLHQHPQRAWTAEQIARELRGNASSATDFVRYFVGAGIVQEQNVGQYQYAADAATQELLTNLASAYAERPVSVIDLIYAQPQDQVQLLADAFKLKKD